MSRNEGSAVRKDVASAAGASALEELRERIAETDRELLDCIHRRMDLAAEIGRIKAAEGLAIFVPAIHEEVIRRARGKAEACGVSEHVMEAIYTAVMRGSIERQHKVVQECKFPVESGAT